MNQQYDDIMSRIAEPPIWFDERAVPRWCEFVPRERADVYAREVILMLVECQSCGHEFKVAMSWSEGSSFVFGGRRKRLSEIDRNDHHYGDPPNIGCCPAGPTMNSVPRSVLEFWDHPNPWEWTRRPELEGAIKPEWMDDEPDNAATADAAGRERGGV